MTTENRKHVLQIFHRTALKLIKEDGADTEDVALAARSAMSAAYQKHIEWLATEVIPESVKYNDEEATDAEMQEMISETVDGDRWGFVTALSQIVVNVSYHGGKETTATKVLEADLREEVENIKSPCSEQDAPMYYYNGRWVYAGE